MSSGAKRPEAPLVEQHSLQDIFVTSLAEVEVLGNNARFILCTEHVHHGKAERIVVATIVMPIEGILDAIWLTLDRLAANGVAISEISTDGKRLVS